MAKKPGPRTGFPIPAWKQKELENTMDEFATNFPYAKTQQPCFNCGNTDGGGMKWDGFQYVPCPSCNHQGRI